MVEVRNVNGMNEIWATVGGNDVKLAEVRENMATQTPNSWDRVQDALNDWANFADSEGLEV